MVPARQGDGSGLRKARQVEGNMAITERLGLKDSVFSIDWDITPEMTFTMFESWGGKDGERIRNNDERFYYFFIDAWKNPPQVCLMERGVKHARVVARINAPADLVEKCMRSQGRKVSLDRSYEVNGALREWIEKTIFDEGREQLVEPVRTRPAPPDLVETGLPLFIAVPDGWNPRALLRNRPGFIREDGVGAIIRAGNFFDARHNPEGGFAGNLMDAGDNATVVDLATGLMWQRAGCDITNIRNVRKYVEKLNREGFAGHHDWRLPTLPEAMSLMRPEKNSRGLHIHKAFSHLQPFIFVADRRKPGGYWFVDYKQGTVFWASGTIPGGFGRVCRTI